MRDIVDGRRKKTSRCGNSGEISLPKTDSGLASIHSFNHFPDNLVVDFLVRLPMKTIFKFKCVSKQWLSLIEDPSFARLFSSRAVEFAQPKVWALLYKCILGESVPPELRFFNNLFSDYVALSYLTVPDLPVHLQALGRQRRPECNVYDYIVAKDENGILLCGFNTRELGWYYILNPVTKQHVVLPPSKRPFVDCLVGFITKVENYVVTSYKIVRINTYDQGESNILKLDILSSETREWKGVDIEFDQALYLVRLGKPGAVVFRGILHFVDKKLGIVAYDPYGSPDCCRIIRLPEYIHKAGNEVYEGKTRLFDTNQGFLRYFELIGTAYNWEVKSFVLWTLLDYEAGLWSFDYQIGRDEISGDIYLKNQSNLEPIAFHPLDVDIVYLGYDQHIFSCDMRTGKVLDLGNSVDLKRKNINWNFVFLFELPLWPISIQETSS